VNAIEVGPGSLEPGNNRVFEIVFGFKNDDIADRRAALAARPCAAGRDLGDDAPEQLAFAFIGQ
jgi:hypothetical protein